jgi:glycosyltransferase involved in cell wall biosynthesis
VLSLIIPAKELDDYLFETVCKYKLNIDYDYEIIIVYDLTNKSLYNKFFNYFSKDKLIKLIFNPNKGRINALNLGFTHSKGNIIKCIDADDTLLDGFFEELVMMDKFPAHCHNAKLVNENNIPISSYTFDINILNKNYKFVLSNLKSAPRWVWSFKREIAEYIFPIPPELFAEDIWFCLIIKKYCKSIYHINRDLYLYKQHSGSEWGGITNFNHNVMVQRAKWNLALFPVLLNHKEHLNIDNDSVFIKIKTYYEVLLGEKKITNIMFAKTTIFYKSKLFIILYFPSIATSLLYNKWLFSKYLIMVQSTLKIIGSKKPQK